MRAQHLQYIIVAMTVSLSATAAAGGPADDVSGFPDGGQFP
jgi:hypothetical protein